MTKRSTFAKKNLIKQNKQKCFLFYIAFLRVCVRVVFGREELFSKEKRRGEPRRAEYKRAQASRVESIYLISNPITKQKDTYLDCRLVSNSRLTYVTVRFYTFFHSPRQ